MDVVFNPTDYSTLFTTLRCFLIECSFLGFTWPFSDYCKLLLTPKHSPASDTPKVNRRAYPWGKKKKWKPSYRNPLKFLQPKLTARTPMLLILSATIVPFLLKKKNLCNSAMDHSLVCFLKKTSTVIISLSFLSLTIFNLFCYNGFFLTTFKILTTQFLLLPPKKGNVFWTPYFSYNSFIHCQHTQESLKSYILSLLFSSLPRLKVTDFAPVTLLKCFCARTPMMTLSLIQWKNFSCYLAWSPCSMWHCWPLLRHFWPWFSFYFGLGIPSTSVLCLLSLKCSLNVDVCLSVPLALIY